MATIISYMDVKELHAHVCMHVYVCMYVYVCVSITQVLHYDTCVHTKQNIYSYKEGNTSGS